MVYIVKTGIFEQLRTRKSLKNTEMLRDASQRNFLGKTMSRNSEKSFNKTTLKQNQYEF
jgi:hypothetical protein